MWKWMALFLTKNNLLRCWGCLFLLIGFRFLTLSLLLKLSPGKSEPVKFLSPEVAPHAQRGMEYCCHVWPGASMCYLELLDKPQKHICRTPGPSLAASLEPLAHWWNVVSASVFWKYYFGRCSSELAQLVLLSYSRVMSTCYSDRFYVTIARCYKDVYVNSFFPRTTRLWNSLPTECFPLTYDLNSFKTRISRHLSTGSSF